jgi:hypothetical protein
MPKKKADFDLGLALKFKRFLVDKGYDPIQTTLLLMQAADESNGFSHPNAIADNNYAGLKYRKSFGKLATPSTIYFAPASEDNGHRVPYAHFNSMEDFVKAWALLAHLNDMINNNRTGPPLQAHTIEEYAHRLKLNGYYQASESIYLPNLKLRMSQLARSGILDDLSKPIPADPFGPIKDYLGQTRKYIRFAMPFGPQAMIMSLAGPAVENATTMIRKTTKMAAASKKLSKIQKDSRTKKYPSIPHLTGPFNGLAKNANAIEWPLSSVVTGKLLVNRNAFPLAYEVPNISNGRPLDRAGHDATARPPKNKKANAKGKKERSLDAYQTDTDKKITEIHLHRGLIEHFTVNMSNATDAAHIVKEKVQSALLEVLNYADLNT